MEIFAIIDEETLKLLYLSIPEPEAQVGELKIALLDSEFTCEFENAYYNLETNQFYNI
jgi:hypothetical protein